MTLSRNGDHNFWSIIIVYFFFAWSFYHSPAFIAVPTCLYALPCSQLLRTPTDYSVPLLCPRNLFESAARKVFSLSSFPCHFLERKCTAPPQTQDEGCRRWASCPVAGLPALNHSLVPSRSGLFASTFLLLSAFGQGVCLLILPWNEYFRFATGFDFTESLCGFLMFLFSKIRSFIHFIFGCLGSSCKRAFSSCWREGAPLRRQRGLFLAVVSLAAELGFQAPGSCGCSTQVRELCPEGSRVWGAGLWARWLRRLALVALRQARSSLTRDWTRVPSSGKWILIHCNAREVPHLSFVWAYWTYGYVCWTWICEFIEFSSNIKWLKKLIILFVWYYCSVCVCVCTRLLSH